MTPEAGGWDVTHVTVGSGIGSTSSEDLGGAAAIVLSGGGTSPTNPTTGERQMSTDTLTTLLKGLAEALSPYLANGGADITATVEEVISSEYDFDDMINHQISDIDWSDYGVMTSDNFDPGDHDLMDTYAVEEAIDEKGFATADEVRDIVTEELQQTGAVVTVDNILSTLANALNSAAVAERAA